MKLLIGFCLLISTTCLAQKFKIVFGVSPTYSLTGDNINYTVKPDHFPKVLVEDPRSPTKFDSNSIDWIQNKNYFGFEPSIEMGYRLGKNIMIGLGFFGRKRQLRYDVYLPIFVSTPNYSHTYKLDYTFVASTIGINFENETQDINIGINVGFNYPLNKLNSYYTYDQTFNQYHIRESVTGQAKIIHNFSSFTLNPLIKLTVNKKVSDNFEIGLSVEKQIKNDYGSYISITDNSTSETVLNGSVLGSDLTLGIKVGYKLLFKHMDHK